MTLDYYRVKRSLIKQVIDTKHNDWLRLATEGHNAAADKCAETIGKLYDQLANCDADIDRVKQELINNSI